MENKAARPKLVVREKTNNNKVVVEQEQPKIKQKGDMKDKLIPFLATLLVIGAFVVGLLYGKLTVYEQGGSRAANKAEAAPTVAENQGEQPQVVEKTELTDDEWKSLLGAIKWEKGNKDAKVTIVEFTDYQCPFCGRYVGDAYAQIVKNYVDTNKVRYALMDLTLPFHANAKIAASAAWCAGDQGKYWEMHDKLFSDQTKWSEQSDPKATFTQYAKDIGINTAKFDQCVESGQFDKEIEAGNTMAQKVGANGTPSFYINGKQLVGAQPYAEFQKMLDEALK